jgi:hypothetical protein
VKPSPPAEPRAAKLDRTSRAPNAILITRILLSSRRIGARPAREADPYFC